jgi:hypothetical protein
MKVKALYLGNWFQRTQLHLSEVHDFLVGEPSPLKLDKKILAKNRKALGVLDIHTHIGRLNSLRVNIKNHISFTMYEDGLTLFRHDNPRDLKKSMEELTDFYVGPHSSAISYLFSLGAPIPKELANIEIVLPYFVVVKGATKKDIQKMLDEYKVPEYFEKSLPGFDLYRGNHIYIINQKTITDENLERFISELVFFREFRGQLHRYLNLHRVIWENISEVKERGTMRGSEIKPFKTKIESYEKTVNLIDTRINQMQSYITTRSAILKDSPELLEATDKVFSFEHETLADSLSYIKDVWVMTKNYVAATLSVFSDLQSKVLNSSVKDLTFITTIGVGATIYKLLGEDPSKLTSSGLWVFGAIALLSIILGWILRYVHFHKKYKIKDIKIDKDIS